jgi:hypothetical protein
MKQLIEDLISAMEYHVEQTRPIHCTTVALQAAREALKAMPTHLACDCYQGQVCHVCDPITPPAAQRQWVGLTDEEIVSAIYEAEGFDFGLDNGNVSDRAVIEYVRIVEAKLKEKNT